MFYSSRHIWAHQKSKIKYMMWTWKRSVKLYFSNTWIWICWFCMMDKVLILWIYVHVFLLGNCNKSVISDGVVYICMNFAHETNTWVSTIIIICFFEYVCYHTMMLLPCTIACVKHIRPTGPTCSSIFSKQKKGGPSWLRGFVNRAVRHSPQVTLRCIVREVPVFKIPWKLKWCGFSGFKTWQHKKRKKTMEGCVSW